MENNTPVTPQAEKVNTHLVLAIVSLCLTPLMGFFALPAAIASFVFALKAENDLAEGHLEPAQRAARYAGIFGWVAIILFALPWVALLIGLLIVSGVGLAFI
ncbi:hypothetical protein Dip510_000527 [Elusimicrobium posterum]|uniref:CD225/dispanin family protein n=1 Tax=Elusimicrobium posterum TaxID=3116653 RepID=UPI003C75CEDC